MYSESQYDHIFKALGHSGRREILDLIKDKPHTTSELCLILKKMDRCTGNATFERLRKGWFDYS